ncbi:hypothetical protein GDO81_028254 [Engystomops pustulosus]|uniref:Uncharacterized protein n=1 Tax=Engystomops pustulosus TaxID=76066 RepID=A0AAV6ZLB6_ENGPU|nr:hypothetical protein GDO81_028254 [Engystomops pustulosus]
MVWVSGSSEPPREMVLADTWDRSLSGSWFSPEPAAKRVGLAAAGYHQVVPQVRLVRGGSRGRGTLAEENLVVRNRVRAAGRDARSSPNTGLATGGPSR